MLHALAHMSHRAQLQLKCKQGFLINQSSVLSYELFFDEFIFSLAYNTQIRDASEIVMHKPPYPIYVSTKVLDHRTIKRRSIFNDEKIALPFGSAS